MVTYVLNKDGIPLMPTKRRGWVRKLLKRGEAKVIRREPFTIQLLYETGDVVQECTLGVNVGSKIAGVGVVGKREVLYQSEVKLRDDIKEKMDDRREHRKFRRKRKRGRPKRNGKRANSIKQGRIPPSIKSKINSTIKEIELCKKIMPITKVVLEVGAFDTHLLKRHDEPFNRSWGYQKGPNYGYENRKQYIRARDNYTCQICGAKTTKNKKVELEVHHIRPKSMGGTDDETNLVTLCKSCHDKVHKGKLVINDQNIRDTENLKYASHMNIICSQLCKRYTEAEKTYGYITKLNRELLGLPKNHCNDACVIASGGEPFVASQYKYVKRCVPKGRYSLTILKGGKVIFRPTGKKCGFRNNDKVKYKGKTFYVSGPMKTGYCDLRDLEGNKINHKELYDTTYCKLKDLKRLNRPRTTLCSQTRV